MEFSLGLGYLPVIWSLITLSAVVVSYAVSVSNGHVYPFLPAISDTGSRSPEANIFSMLMNMSIFMSLFNFYTRFYQCQLQAKYCRDSRETVLRLNRIAAFFAGCSILGAVVVANVQSRKEHYMLEVHDSGAVLLFTFGGFYFWIQTILTFKMRSHGVYTSCICHLRLALTVLITISSVTFFTASTYGYQAFIKNNRHHHHIDHWMKGDGGYFLHVLSNTAEWVSLFSFLGLALSFFNEFQAVVMSVECHEKRPNVISAYDELNEYSTLKMNSEERCMSEEELNHN
eukprot:gene6973-7758_t